MSSILVVEDSRTQAQEIQLLLEEEGFTVQLASQGREALAVLRQGLPDVVLTDLDMPEMNGLQLVEAVRRDYPAVPVILMTALGSEEIAVEALQKGAASYVPKRNLAQDIVETLDRVISVAQAGRNQQRVWEGLTQSDLHFVLDNDPSLAPPLIGFLEEHAARLLACDRNELMRLGVALHEALLNAIQHGNLELSSDLRQEGDEKAFRDLAGVRRQQSPYRDRRVRVHAQTSKSEALYIIEDEGPGFNVASLPDPSDPANVGRIGGRGLTLIRTFMDEVRHNEQGNRITLRKRCGKKTIARSP
jgi:CheY-like chemotaxis protein/anti-sigma regulatory factor (Ser/Thr protein kinase)